MGKSSTKIITVLSHVFNSIALALIIGYGVWFISSGRFPNFHYLENYYVDQSLALLKGQVSLLQQPDPRLAALADTHDAASSHIPFLWDVSYFHGKYYLYWGPAPALFYAIYSVVSSQPAPAQLGVLVAYVGIAGVLLGLLYILRRRYFPRAPVFSTGVFLLAACINPAYAFLLSRPLTYETAILSGQLFLLSGLFFWLLYLLNRKGWLLIFTGLFWGLAVLARYDTLISVLVYTGATLLYIWRTMTRNGDTGRRGNAETDGASEAADPIVADASLETVARLSPRLRASASPPVPLSPSRDAILLLAPLAFCALALVAYNFVRFGDPFEMGLKYQLTTPVVHYYSPEYVKSNLYVYLLLSHPVLSRFPFINISHFKAADLPWWAAAAGAIKDGKQFDYGFFGLFHSTPIFWFEALALLILAGIWVYGKVSAAVEGRRGDAVTGRRRARRRRARRRGDTAVPVTGEAAVIGVRRARPLWPPGWLVGNGSGRPPERAVGALRPRPTGLDRLRPAIIAPVDTQTNAAIRSLTAMLLLAGLLQLVFLLFYYYSAVRFLSDFFLPLLLGGFLIIWQADRYLYGISWLRGIFWLGLVILALQTVVTGFYSGLNLFPYYFSHHNPALFREVVALATRYQREIYVLLKPASIFH